MTINQRVEIIRENKGMSLSEFGRILGVSKSYISMIGNEQRTVTPSIIRKLVSTLCISREWLICGKGDMYDTEAAELKRFYGNLLTLIRHFPNNCARFRGLLLPPTKENEPLTILERISVPIENYRASDMEPKDFINTLIAMYEKMEFALNSCIKAIKTIKSPVFADFYYDDKNEIDRVSIGIIELRDLVINNRKNLERTTDNNELLGMAAIYNELHRHLDYRENIQVLTDMQERIGRPAHNNHFIKLRPK
jgi:transcriptional regulator with XRE-family HTH domain